MVFITKIYLYDSSQEANNYRGTDYSKYLLMGDGDADNLDDTLDTYELTLTGLNFRTEFAPSTRFIIEKYQNSVSEENLYKTWEFIVKDDTVSQPIISDETYFEHHITLIEAGADAQQRLVDNIAVTYKLKDVSIDVLPTYDPDQKINYNKTNAIYDGTIKKYGKHQGFLFIGGYCATGHKFIWEMPDYYTVPFSGGARTPTWNDWDNFEFNQELPNGQSSGMVEIPIPMLKSFGYIDNTKNLTNFNCYCSIEVIINELDTINNEVVKTDRYKIDPSSQYNIETTWSSDEDDALLNVRFGHIVSRMWFEGSSVSPSRKISKISELGNTSDGTLLTTDTPFTTLLQRLLTITIRNGYTYEVSINRYAYNSSSYYQVVDKYPALYSYWEDRANMPKVVNYVGSSYPLIKTKFKCYEQGETGKIIFQQSPPANAYDLFNKCQIASSTIKKEANTPIDETNKVFYLSEEDKEQLKNTTIIENFYNQKNLWELFMDIGKYIHARPKVVYGADNKFKVEWKRYGKTEQFTNNAFPLSVYNSRFIEEYISSLSSYVTNMVQLGGIITETVMPKSSSEDYLVYNDVAEIIVSKPIIELVKVFVTCIDSSSVNYNIRKCLATDDLTDLTNERESGYIYEEGVYKCLDISGSININKGNSLYYKLGTNKIVGLDYRLPTPNNDADYAIKVIIAEVYGITTNISSIKVNDYIFEVSYRTKDTLRTDQTRPDLRDYLLTSKYDRNPIHSQFNNQQDIVVDSTKFGNNMYGKLIRTGNSVYTMVEWVDDLTKLKHSGELYNIFGNLYYVSKVKNTYYTSHAISEVEFSKDFNRLSQIIGIPSEPRFYEISEQSSIDREVALNDYILLSTNADNTSTINFNQDSFLMSNATSFNYLLALIFHKWQSPEFSVYKYPQFAITYFKGDVDKNNTFVISTISPISTFSVGTTLTMEWDMEDNFSAGDQVEITSNTLGGVDKAYNKLVPYQYCDQYGRADLLDFAIIKDNYYKDSSVTSTTVGTYYTFDKSTGKYSTVSLPSEYVSGTSYYSKLFSNTEFQKFPKNPYIDAPSKYFKPLFANHTQTISAFGKNTDGIGLLKDNREVVKMNYNLQLITDSDRFVLSSYFWKEKNNTMHLCLYKEETNKLSTDTFIFENNNVKVIMPLTTSMSYNGIKIDIESSLNTYVALNPPLTLEELMTDVKSLIVFDNSKIINQNPLSSEKYFLMARNIDGITETENTTALQEKTKNWYLSTAPKSIYPKQ